MSLYESNSALFTLTYSSLQHAASANLRKCSVSKKSWHNNCNDNGPLLVVFGSSLPSSTKKNNVRVGPSLIKFSGSAHGYFNFVVAVFVTVLCLFRMVSWAGLRSVIVALPGHTP